MKSLVKMYIFPGSDSGVTGSLTTEAKEGFMI